MQYRIRAKTPLKYHTVNRNAVIPIFGLFVLMSMVIQVSQPPVYYWLHALDTVVFLAVCGLLPGAFYGFKNWRYYGYVCFMVYLPLQLIYWLLYVAVFASLGTDLLPETAVYVALYAAYAAPTFVYYAKRRLIFEKAFNDPPAVKVPADPWDRPPAAGRAQPELPGPEKRAFCSKCGAPLEFYNDRFCSCCGATVK